MQNFKYKLFPWLVLYNRILTINMLAIHGWPYDPICQLRLQASETTTHLCEECPFVAGGWPRLEPESQMLMLLRVPEQQLR